MGGGHHRNGARTRWWIGIAALALGWTGAARAEDADIWHREKLTGDWGGSRTWLKDQKGIEFSLAYIGETLSVMSGGLRRGTSYEGRFDAMIDADLGKLAGWTGGHIQIRSFQIHDISNRNAADFTGSIADPSNIDALPTTRLFTAWFEQSFGKVASLRIGQLAADDEFFTSTTAGGLINGTFGWPGFAAANLPGGGPAYPLAAPGVRLQLNPTDTTSILAALFSGNPAGSGCIGNPQECNRYGTTFSLSGGALGIVEARYQVNQDKDATGLAAAYKIGGWYHTADFADQRLGLDANGIALPLAADPTLAPLNRPGNWALYGLVDQMIWRGKDASTSVFLRGGAAPSDRNLVEWYVDAGVGFKGVVPGRADDTLTLGIAHSHISRSATGFDQDTLAFAGPPYFIRNGETVFEASYIWQVAPWWSVQPDIQYIVRPGGGVADPNNPAVVVGNAFVAGVRSTVNF